MTFEKEFVEKVNATIDRLIDEFEKVDPNDYLSCDYLFDTTFDEFESIQSEIFTISESRGFSVDDTCKAPIHLAIHKILAFVEDEDVDNISKLIDELRFVSSCLLVKDNKE